jgi:NADH-quinone oxidoreductase subunit G
LLGNAAVQHADYAVLAVLSQAIADMVGATCGQIGDAANSVGAFLANAIPGSTLNALQMVAQPRRAYLLMGIDPTADHASPALISTALTKADSVIAMTVFKSDELMALADCLLPIAPFTETSGTFVNTEGLPQSFNGVVRAAGDARPAWKVLRVLAESFGSTSVAFDSSEAVRDEALKDIVSRLAKRYQSVEDLNTMKLGLGLERVADVPLYATDALVRRAPALQQTRDARQPRAFVNAQQAAKLGLSEGDKVTVSQEGAVGKAIVDLGIDPGLPLGVIRLSAGHSSTAMLRSMVGIVELARA